MIKKNILLFSCFLFLLTLLMFQVDARLRYGACCDSTSDCVTGSSCWNSGSYHMDIDQDSDQDYCLDNDWYDCGNEGETTGCGNGEICDTNHDCVLAAEGCVDSDSDTYDAIDPILCPGSNDCDDTDPNVHPDATEVCDDGIDNDCDGDTDCDDTGCDDDCSTCVDSDNDGFGVCPACGVASGCFVDGHDCDDTDTNINPGRAEICDDGIDNDCDGDTDCDDTGCAGDPACPVCDLTSVSWSVASVMGGEQAPFSLEGTNCGSTLVTMMIYEYDWSIAPDDLVNNGTPSIPIVGMAGLDWNSVWTYTADQFGPGLPENDDDDSGDGARDYYLKIHVKDDPSEVVQSGNLEVTKPESTCEGPGEHKCDSDTCCNGDVLPSLYSGTCCDETCIDATDDCGTKECGGGTNACGGSVSCGTCPPAGNSGATQCNSGTCEVPCDTLVEACDDKYGAGNYECGFVEDRCGTGIEQCPPGCSGTDQCIDGTCWTNDECTLVSASWNTTTAWEGDIVALEVRGTSSCNEKTVTPKIWEDDLVFDDYIEDLGGTDADPFNFDGSGFAEGTWIAEYHAQSNGLPKYYFKVFTNYGETDTTKHDGNKYLFVDSLDCSGILSCDDYATPDACVANRCSWIVDPFHAGVEGLTCDEDVCFDDEDPAEFWEDCGCIWDGDETTGSCKFAYTEFECSGELCDGNGIQEDGEACDGGDLDGFTALCTSFGLTGAGPVTCDANCWFDLSNCISSCSIDGLVDYGNEACDGLNFSKNPSIGGGTWECSDFEGYDGGVLGCTSGCGFDFSGCTWSEQNREFSIGTCSRYQDTDPITCEDEPVGFYITSWSGDWNWGHDAYETEDDCLEDRGATSGCANFGTALKWRYDPNGKAAGCTTGGDTTIECPAEIKLPFFSLWNLVFVFVMLIISYMLILKHKK